VADDVKARKLIVFGVGDTGEQPFFEYFKKFGDVEDYIVLKDPGSMQPRGYGFVVFRDHNGA